MPGKIEAYCYSEGTAAVQANQSLSITAPVAATVRPSAPELFSTQLATWKTQLDALGVGTWTVAYSTATRRVTVSKTGAAFTLFNVGNFARWAGYTQGLGGSYASITAASPPGARADLLGVTVEPAEDYSQTELARYRHGRGIATVWGNHQIHRCTLHGMDDAVDALRVGYLQAGRVRLWQGDSGAALTAYNPLNPGGYVDGYVIACGPPVEQSERWWSWDMLIGVPR